MQQNFIFLKSGLPYLEQDYSEAPELLELFGTIDLATENFEAAYDLFLSMIARG